MKSFCPPGFMIIHISSDRKHTYYQCRHTKNIYGKVLQCTYKMRTDRPKPVQHKHVYDSPLENYFGTTKISKNIDVQFYSLIANIDLSINAASSLQMYNFIRMCIQIGQSNPNTEIESLFSFNSRNTLRRNFCQYAKTNKESTLRKYSSFPFNSLVIDAGMNHGVSYLIAIV